MQVVQGYTPSCSYGKTSFGRLHRDINNTQSAGNSIHKVPVYKPYTNPHTTQVQNPTEQVDTTVEKPGFGKSVGQGIWNGIKLSLPFIGSYTAGKEYLEQKNAIEDLKALKEGKEPTSKKPGKIKSFFTGVGLKLAQFVPFLGSYLVGKQKLEQDNAIRELNGEEPKKAGFFKSVLTGAATKLGYCVPFLGTYLMGQEFAEQDKLVDKVEELKGQKSQMA